MNLFEMDAFVEAISKYLKLNQPFNILKENEELTWEPRYNVPFARDLESIQIFADYLFEHVGVFDFRTLPEDYFYKICVLVDLLDRLIQNRKKRCKERVSEILIEAESKILALRLGGRVHFKEIERMDQELLRFIKSNKLDKKFFTLGLQLSETLAIPFEIEPGEYQEILWSELKKETLIDARGNPYGYRFFYKEHFVMETDHELLLTEEFSLLYKGISYHHKTKALHIPIFDKRNKRAWKEQNVVELYTVDNGAFLFLMLRSDLGDVYSIGVEEGYLASPTEYYYDSYQCKYTMVISKEEFQALFKKLEEIKYYKKKMSPKALLRLLQEELQLEELPEKVIVTKNKFLSYLTLPYAVLKFFSCSELFHEYTIWDLFFRPYEMGELKKGDMTEWLQEGSISREGEERCCE